MSTLLLLLACVNGRDNPTDETDTDIEGPGRAEGSPCDSSAVCMDDLVCSGFGTCEPQGDPGTLSFGDSCASTTECQLEFACASDGTCAVRGGDGTTPRGEECSQHDQCAAGLSCYQQQCTGPDIVRDPGVVCPTQSGAFRVHFELPGPREDGDVFRAPFPSDLEHDLADWPRPAWDPDGLTDALFDAYRRDFQGHGANQPVFFRFSSAPNFNSLRVGPPGDGEVALIDLTPESPSYGQVVPTGWKYTAGRRFLCDPWLAIYPGRGQPLRSGGTYAAVIASSLEGETGAPAVPDPVFSVMLAPTAPVDAAQAAAWEVFQPLRSWLDDSALDADAIAGASVFTVEDYAESARQIRVVARDRPAPTHRDVHRCAGEAGPFADPDDPTRGCLGGNNDFEEIQGIVELPHVQLGTPPYVTADAGGWADWAGGRPGVEASSPVVFSMSIPDGEAPIDGWPLVIFAHDGAGNYRSAISQGFAELMSVGDTRFAVLSIDGWMTGPRRGDVSTLADAALGDAEVLRASPLHPVAARDHVTQAAMDVFSLVYWLETVDWSDPQASPLDVGVRFDLDEVHLVAHGSGGSMAPIAMAHEPRIRTGVLANTGAWWTASLDAVEPVRLRNYSTALVGDDADPHFQPLLQLGQGVVDRTDPVTHGRSVIVDAADAGTHVLHIVVPEDPRTTEESQTVLAYSLFTEQISGSGSALEGVPMIEGPVSGNAAGTTAVSVSHTGSDPRRVLFESPAREQVHGFLTTAVTGGTPTVPQ